MRTYILLLNFTEQGIRNIKETAKRAEAFKAMAKKAGVTVREIWWTLGHYDGAVILEAPDEETAMALGLNLCSLRNVR